jgi:hypothetical protein
MTSGHPNLPSGVAGLQTSRCGVTLHRDTSLQYRWWFAPPALTLSSLGSQNVTPAFLAALVFAPALSDEGRLG